MTDLFYKGTPQQSVQSPQDAINRVIARLDNCMTFIGKALKQKKDMFQSLTMAQQQKEMNEIIADEWVRRLLRCVPSRAT